MVNNLIQHSKSKAKFIIEWAHCYQCQTNHINFYKITLWVVRTLKAHLPIAWMHVVVTITLIHLLPDASSVIWTLYWMSTMDCWNYSNHTCTNYKVTTENHVISSMQIKYQLESCTFVNSKFLLFMTTLLDSWLATVQLREK